MKKSKKAMIFTLCLSPMMILTACVPPSSYTISASSSDIYLGYVKGFDKNEKQEGSKVTLSAVSTSDAPFLCWVKDNKTIVSNESDLNLSYSSETSGHYTAIFEENDYSKMQYASLVDFDFNPSGYTKVEYQINTALLASGSTDYYEFINGEYSFGDKQEMESSSVMYFGGIGEQFVYLIKINFKLFDSKNQETTFEYSLQTKIDKDLFNGKGGIIINEEIKSFDNTPISLTFEKISLDEIKDYETATPDDNNNSDDVLQDPPITPPSDNDQNNDPPITPPSDNDNKDDGWTNPYSI